ncbi:hypothetical protein BDEG_27865 [Batrachochytrium dendrobatidis JEL423]|uniref:Uncharacterized protein n=1 Tax=Batrachochytrium dendrobatidis (strain JEL423) TaxID=403673 RepID=A0A177WYF9_BATDL|nr:hypothetical protein BDEG_27865 [Batrachochytrium dendrobatidis JEL423]
MVADCLARAQKRRSRYAGDYSSTGTGQQPTETNHVITQSTANSDNLDNSVKQSNGKMVEESLARIKQRKCKYTGDCSSTGTGQQSTETSHDVAQSTVDPNDLDNSVKQSKQSDESPSSSQSKQSDDIFDITTCSDPYPLPESYVSKNEQFILTPRQKLDRIERMMKKIAKAWVCYNLELESFKEMSINADDVKLIQGYLEKDQKREKAKKACDSAKSEELNQEELLKRLSGKNYKLSLKYSNRNDPVYQEKKREIKQKLNEENEKLFSLQQKRLKLDKNLYHAGLLLHIARKELADLLFQNGPSTASLYSRIKFLKSNPSFVEDIYQSFILQLNKQSGSDPSSSSKTSTDQPTQTSSSTQKSSKSSKSHSRFSRLWKISKSKNERKSFSSPPSSEDSDESPV